MVNSKHAFWQALIFTVIVFGIGLLIGYYIENTRTNKVEINILNSETNLLDEQLRSENIRTLSDDCNISKESMFRFADNIYEEAQQLEQYESQSKFTETLKILHKRYDLLRVMLWVESVNSKEKCSSDFHTLVYIYEYAPEEISKKAEQAALSRLLLDMKNNNGNKILLIPIAGNLDLESINVIKNQYKINKLPVLIVDEKVVIRELPTYEELEKLIFRS
jgi:hypothetical protein